MPDAQRLTPPRSGSRGVLDGADVAQRLAEIGREGDHEVDLGERADRAEERRFNDREGAADLLELAAHTDEQPDPGAVDEPYFGQIEDEDAATALQQRLKLRADGRDGVAVQVAPHPQDRGAAGTGDDLKRSAHGAVYDREKPPLSSRRGRR